MHRIYSLFIFLFICLVLTIAGCAGTYVGVGIHTPGPWGGPYPHSGGTVIIGRPMPAPYLPLEQSEQNAVAAQRMQTIE